MKTLTVAEVADFLHCSRTTVYRLVRSGRLRFVRVGSRMIRFRIEDVQAYLDGNRTDGAA